MHDDLKKHVRAHYLNLMGYVSAGMQDGKKQDMVFMNANENPFVLPGLEGMNFYPEPQPADLRASMANAYDVDPHNLLITRGADESISLITRTFCEPGKDSVLIHTPTFGIYGVDAKAMPANLISVPLVRDGNKFSLDVDGMIAAINDPANAIKLVYLCSPNNPTGGSFPQEDLIKIITAAKGKCMVVMDEAYGEFCKHGTMVQYLDQYPHMLILRTLSKAYGLAGVRIGATLSHDPEFIAFLSAKVHETYPLPKPAIAAAKKALSPEMRAQAQENMDKSVAECQRLRAYFEKAPFCTCVFESDANFLLIEVKNAQALWQYCFEHGFIMRDFSDKPGTENCIRVSPGTPEQNDRFFEILDQYTQKQAA